MKPVLGFWINGINHMRIFWAIAVALTASSSAPGETRTWDGRHDTQQIEVTVVYFVPSDRHPLPDWRERVDYYCRRIELFHAREFQGQSTLKTLVRDEPLVSRSTTEQLRRGDANSIFFRTLREADRRVRFATEKGDAFPILLVLSDINWRPLDDFYRLGPRDDGFAFEGNYRNGQHFPGAESGGARATYLADRGAGWGLVSGDGWRVPYRGSDCVVYHEGCGHTVGLPHPDRGDGSVMSLGQYRGWIHESWLNEDQKSRLKWEPRDVETNPTLELFSKFRALPSPHVPRPGQSVALELQWPEGAKVRTLRVRFQTSIDGPWIEVPQRWNGDAPSQAELATFDRDAPVSYRVDAILENGAAAELWGYFQVRTHSDQPTEPRFLSADLITRPQAAAAQAPDAPAPPTWSEEEVDLLQLADVEGNWSVGDWSKVDGKLISPKAMGARLELPYEPSSEYRLVAIVEPLDDPNGLILGQCSNGHRFLNLFHFDRRQDVASAIENIDDQNVGNDSTFTGQLFQKNRLSQIVITVAKNGVTMSVDGRNIVSWTGEPDRLTLSDYWKTPNDKAIFVGAYDCSYRFHRLTLQSAAPAR